MIQETTTITTEAMRIDSQFFTIKTYEMTVTGFCDICGQQESGK